MSLRIAIQELRTLLKAMSHEAIFFLQLATQIWVKKILQAPVEL